jgi:hypothetical protein
MAGPLALRAEQDRKVPEQQPQCVREVALLVFGQAGKEFTFACQHGGNEIIDGRVSERGEFYVDGSRVSATLPPDQSLRFCPVYTLRDRACGDERGSSQLARGHPIRLAAAPQGREQVECRSVGAVSAQ